VIGLSGRLLLRLIGNSRSSSSDGKGSGGIIVAVVLIAITLATSATIGFFSAGLIKAALSRQREYLADGLVGAVHPHIPRASPAPEESAGSLAPTAHGAAS